MPEWAAFPEDVEDGQTSFLCELDRNEAEGQIVRDLESFDPSLILFLNNISRVDIEVHRDHGHCWTKAVTRRDIDDVNSRISVLQDGSEELFYRRSTFFALNLPSDPRGGRRSSSELLLAFPGQHYPNGAPSKSTQNVCSGLPIGNHGLKVSSSAHHASSSRLST